MRPKTNNQYKYLKDQREKRRVEKHIESMSDFRDDPLEWLSHELQHKKVSGNGNLLKDERYADTHEINEYIEV